jgi:hypothetical protein
MPGERNFSYLRHRYNKKRKKASVADERGERDDHRNNRSTLINDNLSFIYVNWSANEMPTLDMSLDEQRISPFTRRPDMAGDRRSRLVVGVTG